MINALLRLWWRLDLARLQRRWNKMGSPTPCESVLAFNHVAFGREEFEVDSARFNIYDSDDGVAEFTVVVSAGKCLKPSELQDVATGNPWFEATAIVANSDLELHPRLVIRQDEGYDYCREINLSNIFYLSHSNVEDLKIEILNVGETSIEAIITGSAVINGSLLTNPDARFSLHTELRHDEGVERGVK